MVKNTILLKVITTCIKFIKLFLSVFAFLHCRCQLNCATSNDINIGLNSYRINAQPAWMLSSVPVARFFSCQFMSSVIRQTQRMEQSVELFGIRKFKNQTLQFLSIIHSVLYSIANFLNMEESLQIVYICEKEVKKIIEITPLAEEQRQLICSDDVCQFSRKIVIT